MLRTTITLIAGGRQGDLSDRRARQSFSVPRGCHAAKHHIGESGREWDGDECLHASRRPEVRKPDYNPAKNSLQGDHSGCVKPPVDITTKVWF